VLTLLLATFSFYADLGIPFAIAIAGVPASALRNVLSSRGVYVSTGSACADADTKKSHVLEAIGLSPDDGMVRLSFGLDTTADEVARAATILADVEPQSQVAQEEIFGPVLAVIRYRDLDDAVRIANDTSYGLSGAVYSADPATASRLASELRCGSVHINNGMNVDIDVPFGGFKSSGYGREYGPEGVQEYTEPKVVFLDSAVAS